MADLSTVEVDTLEAGPELDALVAEHVLSWKRIEFNGQSTGLVYVNYELPINGERKTQADIPYISLNMGSAWLVVEAMQSKGFVFSLYGPGHQVVGDPHWGCRFSDREFTRGFDRSLTAPLAICRAALKAATTP